MKHLKKSQPKTFKERMLWITGRRFYELEIDVHAITQPYNKLLTIPKGRYDGATLALDAMPDKDDCDNPNDVSCIPAWLIHDAICQQECPKFNDGTPITSIMAARVLEEHLLLTGEPVFRASAWHWATKTFGCKSTKVND